MAQNYNIRTSYNNYYYNYYAPLKYTKTPTLMWGF
jgi:hypothetical protein